MTRLRSVMPRGGRDSQPHRHAASSATDYDPEEALRKARASAVRAGARHDEAEDIAHDSFVKALQTGAPDVIGCCVVAARTLVIDRIRRRMTAARHFEMVCRDARWAPGESPSAAEEAERNELALAVRAAVEALPTAGQRDVMRLELGGSGRLEAASAMGMNQLAVRALAWRARTALRRSLLGWA